MGGGWMYRRCSVRGVVFLSNNLLFADPFGPSLEEVAKFSTLYYEAIEAALGEAVGELDIEVSSPVRSRAAGAAMAVVDATASPCSLQHLWHE